jgi:hypothetical protein
MALVLKDRVLETCTSPGTGTITLLGAVTGYQAFSTVGNGNTCYYAIADQNGANWEVGIGTYSSGTLARTTVLSSSNAGSLTNFSTGTQNVFLTYPSERSVNLSSAALTSGRVTYATTDGLLTDSAGLTYNSGNLFTFSHSSDAFLYVTSTGNAASNISLRGGGANAAYGSINNYRTDNSTQNWQIGGIADQQVLPFFTGTTERMRIDSSGNVGIGTSSPTAKLHVSSTTGSTDNGLNNASLFLNTGNESTTANLIRFNGAVAQALSFGRAINSDSFVWNGTSAGELMRLTSGGNVGIGTSSPSYKLDVSNNANAFVARFTGGTSSDVNIGLYANTASAFGSIGTISNHKFQIFTNGNDVAIFDSSGNLGLGVTPSAWYALNKAIQLPYISISGNSGSAVLYCNSYTNASAQTVYQNNGYASLYVQSIGSGGHQWFNAPSSTAGSVATLTQAMTLDASGNLGLGTTVPLNKLTVYKEGTSPIPTGLFGGVVTVGVVSGEPSIAFSSNIIAATGTVGANQTAKGGVGFSYVNSTSPTEFNIGIDGTPTVASNVKIFNGTERMRITSAGNVGIGTTSTTGLITLGKAGGGQYIGALDNTTGYEIGYIQFNSDNMTLNPQGGASGTTGYFRFNTSNLERMRIDSSGNVLIGTTSSSVTASLLQVNTNPSSTNAIDVIGTSGVAGNGGSIGMFADTMYLSANWYYSGSQLKRVAGNGSASINLSGGATDANTFISFATGTTVAASPSERMRIDSSGNVLIGTTTNTAFVNGTTQAVYGVILSKANSSTAFDSVIGQLAIDNMSTTANNYSQLAFTTTDGANRVVTAAIYAQITARSSANWSTSNLQFYTGTVGGPPTEKMRIDSSGNLLVGDTSLTAASEKVSIRSNSTPNLILRSTGNSSMRFYNSSDNAANSCQINYYSGTSFSLETIPAIPMVFLTNNAERMRIASGGLVSITGAGTEVLALNKSGGPSAYLQPVSSTDAGLQVKDSGGTVTLTVGTTGTTVALQGGTVSSGTGIAFPATQVASANANTLDDYEEGTWTPVWTGSTSGSGSPGTITGNYVKVGKMVTISVAMNDANPFITFSGTLRCSLPFPAGGISASQYIGPPIYFYNGPQWNTGSTTAGITPSVLYNTSYMEFIYMLANGDRQSLVNSTSSTGLSSGGNVYARFSMTYIALD